MIWSKWFAKSWGRVLFSRILKHYTNKIFLFQNFFQSILQSTAIFRKVSSLSWTFCKKDKELPSGVFRTLLNIYGEAFWWKYKQLKAEEATGGVL